MKVKQKIAEIKLVPVVKVDSDREALDVCNALCKGGLPIAEITFRTEAAQLAIRRVSEQIPDMLIGAGTVVNVDQAKAALDAGAKFLVCPGFSRSVVEFALEKRVPVFPGVCTPTEIMAAMEYGLNIVKFFPAEQYGGINTIKSLSAPFPGIKFMPTGGINNDNVLEYLSVDAIIACGGSWMVKSQLIKERNFTQIERITAEAVKKVKGLEKY